MLRILALGLSLLLSLAGCSTSRAALTAQAGAEAVNTATVLAAALPAPERLLAATGGAGFAPSRDGADFASDLPNNLCNANDPWGQYIPDWSANGAGLDGAAYALYRLELDPAEVESLELSWLNAVPQANQAWLGLSDWTRDAWEWRVIPAQAEGSLDLAEASAYSTTGQACLVAVVVVGDTPCQLASIGFAAAPPLSYPIVDTMQDTCIDDHGQEIFPTAGQPFYGQDAQYDSNPASYTDNGDGTITDNVTGLMWAQLPNNMEKCTFEEAFTIADSLVLGGYDDWRVPTIKELYSLIDFRGETGTTDADAIPYIDTNYFEFEYGDVAGGERHIDAQYWSSTEYVSTTMGGSPTTFGVNFADGRIKGYGRVQGPPDDQTDMQQFIRCVRGRTDYGVNDFVDNGDGTIVDKATGLMWMQVDSGSFSIGDDSDGLLNWQQALDWAENLSYAGYDDWRLPNAKELESIVDYTRSPATTNSPALDPIFSSTSILDEEGSLDWAQYWTSTTHFDGPPETLGDRACYVCFGEGQGYMEIPPDSGTYVFWDVHGAGCQRSDLKSGDPADFPVGMGPQGDVQRIYNMVRLVRGSCLAE